MGKLMPLCHTRIKTFGEFMELCGFFFVNHLQYSNDDLCPKHLNEEQSAYILQCMIWHLDELEDWGRTGIEKASFFVAKLFGVNHKKIIMPILFTSLTGKKQGPPLFDSFDILGKDRARARFLNAIEHLGGLSKKKLSTLQKKYIDGDAASLTAKDENS